MVDVLLVSQPYIRKHSTQSHHYSCLSLYLKLKYMNVWCSGQGAWLVRTFDDKARHPGQVDDGSQFRFINE